MIQNKLKFILLTAFFCLTPKITQARIPTDSLTYALIKGIIEGGKTGIFHQAEETHKGLYPKIKSTTGSIKMDPINKFNLAEATFEWILNCILNRYTGRTLCSGKTAGIIDYHKLIKFAIIEAARLGVTPASATNDKIIRLYLVNLLRALSIRGFALDSHFFPEARTNSAIALNCLNDKFWDELIAGTVDWAAVKDLGGKYHDLKSGINFVAIDKILDFADTKAIRYFYEHRLDGRKFNVHDQTQDHHIKFITDLTSIFMFPLLKYCIECSANINYKTPANTITGIEKTITPVVNKLCAGTTAVAQTGQKILTPAGVFLKEHAIALYKSVAQTAYNLTHSQPDEDEDEEDEKTEKPTTEKQNSAAA